VKAYRIVDWKRKYEVSLDGKAVRQNTKRLRKGPLPYVRLSLYSESNGMAYRRLLRLAGSDAPAAMGIFCILLEIAANQTSEHRGWILDEHQRPLSAEDLAFELGCEPAFMSRILSVLCDSATGWLEICDRDDPASQGCGAGERCAPDETKSARTGSALYNETETEDNRTEQNETKPQGPHHNDTRQTQEQQSQARPVPQGYRAGL